MSPLLCNTYNTEKGFSSPYFGNSLYEIVADIKTKICPKDIVIIYINMRVGSGKQIEDQQGIELLVRLRLEGIMNHCILHSPERLFDVIAKNPRNSIVTSHGTSFQRTAYNSKDYVTNNLVQNYPEADKIDFVSHLKKYYDIGEIRHRLANKYGVYILSQIYNDYIRDATTDKEISCHLPDEDKLMLDVYKYIANQGDRNTISVIKDIKKILRSFANSRPCVLYIDDMANDGWEDFLVKSIYNDQDRTRFIVNVPQKTDFDNSNYSAYLNNIYKIISASIDQRFVECVLLDVRLLDEQGIFEDIDKLSGIRLLKDIREKFPELPVIITTASNKAETVSHVIKSGATALWTKPGVDYIYSDDYYLNQLFKLLRYVLDSKNKYRNNLEKQIARAGNAVARLSLNNNNFNFKRIYSDIDVIVFDTNIFSYTEKTSELHNIYSSIYKIYRWATQYNKLFVVINDVYLELLVHTRATDPQKSKLKKVSEFALQIFGYYLLDTSNSYDELKKISKTVWSIDEKVNKLGEKIYIVISDHKQNRFCHTDKSKAEKYLLDAGRHGFLHADDSLAYLVPYLCCEKKKNVLFIANDRGLKQRVATDAMVRYGVNTIDIIKNDLEYFNSLSIRISCFDGKYIEMMPHWCMSKLFNK